MSFADRVSNYYFPLLKAASCLKAVALCLVAASSTAFAATDPQCDSQADVSTDLGADKFYEFRHQGRNRSYIVHIPQGYSASKPTEVVFALHGGFGNACDLREKSQLNGLPERYGQNYLSSITVYPNGVLDKAIYGDAGQHWNDGRVADPKMNIDDVDFLHQILGRLVSVHKLNVNHKRVFAMGVSNGGMMVYRLARDSGRFAGVVAISALLPKNLVAPNAPPLRPVPAMMIMGTADGIMPWQGGPIDSPLSGEVLSAEETFSRLNQAHGSPPSLVTAYFEPYLSPGIKQVDWRYQSGYVFGGRNKKRVEMIKLYGGGHCWPGEQSEIYVSSGGFCAQAVDASGEALIFFYNQPDL